jgi:hypothetical protein
VELARALDQSAVFVVPLRWTASITVALLL